MKVKNQYLKILEYLHLSFNKWPSIQYKFRVSLVLWNHNNGEDCWFGNDPEDDHWRLILLYLKRFVCVCVCVCIMAGRYNGLKRLQLEIVIFDEVYFAVFSYICVAQYYLKKHAWMRK